MARAQAKQVDWLAASGRAQTLDVSWLRLDDGDADPDGVAGALARFAPDVRSTRTCVLWMRLPERGLDGLLARLDPLMRERV
jgi:hypothetical protein